MAITTNSILYKDDFITSGVEEKNYLRILFKPGYSVQVRELNQLQSMLQSQIDKFGQSIWKEGSNVLDNNCTFDANVATIDITVNEDATLAIDKVTQLFVGTFAGESLKATVLSYDILSSAQRQYRVYIQYSEAGIIEGVNTNAFKVADEISYAIISESDEVVVNDFAVVNAVGLAARFNQPKSVFFTNGSFVLANKQSVFIPTPENLDGSILKLSGSAVLEISEKYVDYNSDQTLLDNANGEPNFTAPGADRYGIDLSLKFIAAGAAFPAKYVIVSTVKNSVAQFTISDRYSPIDKKLAERTSEESGNYITNPFVLGARELLDTSSYNILCNTSPGSASVTVTSTELLKTGLVASGVGVYPGSTIISIDGPTTLTLSNVISGDGGFSNFTFTDSVGNGGRYKNSELSLAGFDTSTPEKANAAAAAAAEQLCLSLEPSIAYVNGYRIDTTTTGKVELIAKKARTTAVETDINSSTYFGNYFNGVFTSTSTFPTLSTLLYDVKFSEDITRSTVISITTSKILTVSDITGIKVGMNVTGTNIPAGSYVTEIVDVGAKTVQINNFPTDAGTVDLIFGKCGTCRIKSVSNGANKSYNVYVYDLTLNPNTLITDITIISANSVKFLPFSNSGLQLAGQDTSLSLLPYYAISNVSKLTYTTKRYISDTSPSSGSSISLTVDAVDNQSWAVDNIGDIVFKFNDDNDATHYIVNSTLDDQNTTLTLTFSKDFTQPLSYQMILPLKIRNATANSKTKTVLTHAEGVKTILIADGQTTFELPDTSIISVDKVTYGASIEQAVDITNDVILISDGQKSNYYTNGKIEYIGAVPLKETEKIFVSYTYFQHGTVGGVIYPFFTVNSYRDVDNSALPFEQIPTYSDFSLNDTIDFRPTILSSDSPTLNGIYAPAPNGLITLDATYYLPRIDVVALNSFGEFSLKEGTPSLSPVAKDVGNSLALYSILFNAYTFNEMDITSTAIDNKRYTMKDIGKLDKRISNIEYYTSLSLLERSAKDESVVNAIDGSERLKNGIITDNFRGHGVGDVKNFGYRCAIDPASRILHPTYNIDSITFTPNNTVNNVRVHDNTVTLNYIEEPLFPGQFLSNDSISVNPYNKQVFIGNLELSPASDEWMDTTTIPDILVSDTSAYDAMVAKFGTGGAIETVWSSWTTNWKGIFDAQAGRANVRISVRKTAAQPSGLGPARHRGSGRNNIYNTKLALSKDEIKLAISGAAIRRGWRTDRFASSIRGTIENQTRTGVETIFSGSYTTSTTKDTKIVDTSILPYMRSRIVYFKADSLFGGKTVYPFFDGIDVSKYCSQVDEVDYKLWKDQGEVSDYTGILPTDVMFNDVMIATPLIPDKIGQIFGKFLIPNNALQQFKCGARKFRLTDSIINDAAAAFSLADVDYTAAGMIETEQTTITSTRVAEYSQRTVTDSRNLLSNTKVIYHDPLAQSFLIGDIEGGAFVTSVDIFFQSVGTTAPVELHLVSVENGYPTQKVLPFSRVVLNPDQVVADLTGGGTIATNFKFSDPVHLKNGVEYAIVLISNDDAYRVWIATLSSTKKDIKSGNQVGQNTYGGVFFKSSNASTWTADQFTDLMFNINRAKFDTETNGSIRFNSNVPTGVQSISINALNWLTPDGGEVYTVVPQIIISAPAAAGGIRATAVAKLNGVTGQIESLRITNPGKGYTLEDTITVAIKENGQPDGVIKAAFVANLISLPISMLNLNQESIVLNGTELRNDLTYINHTNGKISVANDIVDGQDTKATSITTVRQSSELFMNCSLSTSNEYLTPIIDLERHSVLIIENVINNDSTDEDKYDAAAALSRYITKNVILENPSTRLNIYTSVNLPSRSCNVKVYVKLRYDGGSTPPSDWIEINPSAPIMISSDTTQFTEVQYVLDSDKNDFIEFTTKIVLLSSDNINVPTLSDFRAIATSV